MQDPHHRIQVSAGEYREALRIDPKLSGAYYNIGISYLNQKKNKEALKAFKEVLKINPHYEDTIEKIRKLEK